MRPPRGGAVIRIRSLPHAESGKDRVEDRVADLDAQKTARRIQPSLSSISAISIGMRDKGVGARPTHPRAPPATATWRIDALTVLLAPAAALARLGLEPVTERIEPPSAPTEAGIAPGEQAPRWRRRSLFARAITGAVSAPSPDGPASVTGTLPSTTSRTVALLDRLTRPAHALGVDRVARRTDSGRIKQADRDARDHDRSFERRRASCRLGVTMRVRVPGGH